MAGRKEYILKIKIAGSVDPSLTKSISSIGDSLKGGIGKLDGAFNQLDPAFNQLEAAGKKCFEAIAVAAGTAATAIGIVGQQVLEAGMAFEQQMSTVEAISGADAAQKAALEDRAMSIARTTKFTAEEAGEAYEYMGMAGWNADQMLAGIESTMSLAAASGEDLATVSDILTDDLTAFGMSAEEAGRFADVLAATATSANTNVAMMGDTFKYAAPLAGTLGYSVEDVAIATGLMANNGIKASMAGTSLRNLFQRMAKPTKESAAAMDALGLAIEDSEGNMIPFMEIMQQLRETLGGKINESGGFLEYLQELDEALEEGKITEEEYTAALDDYIAKNDELSQSESVKLAAMLAGARGMAGLLAIVNTSTEDFNALTEAIYGSAGAAEEMANIKLDNLKGDVDIFKSALETVKLEIYDEVNPALRGLVEYGTEAVDSVGTWLPEMIGDIAENIEEKLPQAIEKVKDVAGPLFDGVEQMFGFFMNHGEEVVGVFTGIGTAIITYEIASNVTHIVGWLLKLDPISMTIAAITASVGLIAGYLTTIRLEHEALVEQSLADHFGDISLSLSELQEIADQVAGSGQLERIRNVLDEFSTLEETKKGLEDIQKALDKADWKVSVGLVLSEEDLSAYQRNVESLITQTKTMLEQSWNADIAAASEGLTYNDALTARLSEFYAAKQGELESLGTQLNKAVTDAFQDGFLDFDETQTIANLRQKLTEVQNELSASEFDIQMRMLDRMNFGNLDEASYENLLSGLRKSYDERVEGIDRIWAATTQANDKSFEWEREELQAQLNAHQITYQEYSQQMQELTKSFESVDSDALAKSLGDQADAIRRVMEGSTGGLMTQYAEEMQTAQKAMSDVFKDIRAGFSDEDLKGIAENSEKYKDTIQDIANAVPQMLEQMYKLEGIGTDMEGFSKLAEKLKPTEADAEALKAEYEKVGQDLPQVLLDGMDQVDLILALSGDEHAIYNQLLMYLSEEYPQYNEMVEASHLVGGKPPEGVAEGMVAPENLAKIDEGAAELYNETKTKIEEQFEEGIDVDVPVRVNPIVQVLGAGALGTLATVGSNISSAIGGFAEGGIVSQKQLSWVAEEGPEAIIPLNDSERALSLWKQTGEVLNAKSRLDEPEESGDVTNSMVVTFAPVYNITGNASKADAEKIAQDGFKTFTKYMEQYVRKNNRVMWDRG